MPKKLNKPGNHTTVPVDIHIVSKNGLWILVNDEEFFLSFSEYPWFAKATVDQIFNVKLLHKRHLHWPKLDVDLEVDSLKNPSAYQLKFQK